MALLCPSCQNQVALPQIPMREGIDIRCQNCDSKLRIELALVHMTGKPPVQENAHPVNPDRVLVAVIGEVTEEMISEVLSEVGFTVTTANSTEKMLESLQKERPGLGIFDVGMDGVFDKVIPEIRSGGVLGQMKVILLSSIHNQARYKREPDSLYGADDYIERHHIEDQLVLKAHALMKKKPSPPAPEAVPQPEPQPPAGKAEEETPPVSAEAPARPAAPLEGKKEGPPVQPEIKKQPVPAGDLTEHDSAKRLARLIISDIALYNQKQVEEGVKKGTFHDLLREELEEGQKLYKSRISKGVLEDTRYYEEAITDFIEKQKVRFAGL
jgi:CheY-like chemotaxis protein